MTVQICKSKRVACYARAETFTEAVFSVASMVATPLMQSKVLGPNLAMLPIRVLHVYNYTSLFG